MKLFPVGLCVLAACSLKMISAQAMGLNVFGQGRYLSLTPEKDDGDTEDPKAATGYAAGINAQLAFVDFKVGNVFAGAGLDFWATSESESKMKWTRLSVPLELGVSFNAIPILTFQLAGMFDYGLSGKLVVDEFVAPGSTEAKELVLSTKEDMAYGANFRALMTVAPMVRAGLVAQYITGSYKIDKLELGGSDISDNADSDASKYSGYAIGAVIGVSF